MNEKGIEENKNKESQIEEKVTEENGSEASGTAENKAMHSGEKLDRENKIKENKTGKNNLYIAVGAVAAAVVAAIVVFCVYVNAYDKIMPNTYIEDIKLGGMTQQEAFSVLAAQYSEDKIEGKTINFSCMGDKSTIEVNNLAMVFEPEKMASDAYSLGREKAGFFSKLKSFVAGVFSHRSLRPSLSYDKQALTGSISDLCRPHEIEPLGYTYRVGDNNNIIIAKPQDGVLVDMDDAVSRVEDEICTFRFGDVNFEPVVTKAPEFNLDEFYSYITQPACDASYAKDENGKVYVVPGKPQIVVNKSDIEAAVKQPEIEYSVPVQLVNSAVDANYLQSILYEDTLGSYSTNYGGSSAARASNIARASSTINGYELLPDETFDFNKVVGKRTAAAGYLPAPVYVVKNGETVSEIDYGGGICQVSSTIYCAVARAKLKVVARTSHSKGVSYVPQGMDATVSWGGPEFIFKNSTEFPIRIFAETGGGVLTVRIVGSKAVKPDVNLDVQNDGSSVTVTKTTTMADGSQTTEVFDSRTPPTPLPTQTVSAEPEASATAAAEL